MGWQGGGKHRGTPTPELDKMAAEGMRFWTAYAEPSCTPSRIAGKLGPERQETFEAESIKQITAYIKDKAKDDNPFFIYWATYANQLQGSKAHHNDKHVDRANAQASEMAAHNAHMKQMFETLKAESIAENTLVVWISDNNTEEDYNPKENHNTETTTEEKKDDYTEEETLIDTCDI